MIKVQDCTRNCATTDDCDLSCAVIDASMHVSAAYTANAFTAGMKDTNPKDAIGSAKLPLHLVPSTLMVYTAMAFAEGQAKYGAYNWRIKGVRASIYYSALMRHLTKYWSGEDVDPKTKVPHLASAAACIAVLIDAWEMNVLNDDRPPRVLRMGELIDKEAAAVVAHVRAIAPPGQPHDYTLQDK